MWVGIIRNDSLAGGRARAEVWTRPLSMSRPTAHGSRVLWPLGHMGRSRPVQMTAERVRRKWKRTHQDGRDHLRPTCIAGRLQWQQRCDDIQPQCISPSINIQHSSVCCEKFHQADVTIEYQLGRLSTSQRAVMICGWEGNRRPGTRVTVTQAWNSLPTNVTASTSLPSFKRQLKTFLFTKSFPSL